MKLNQIKKDKRIIFISIIGIFLLIFIYFIFSSTKEKLSKKNIFEKDEYCRKTYSDSFIKNYEKKLIGSKKEERETIKLVDIFYSPIKNECIGIYDYYYFDFRNMEIDDKKINLSMFERRIAKAISADIEVNSFKITMSGRFDNFEEEAKYNNFIKELKSD